jgi:hypothetical protein
VPVLVLVLVQGRGQEQELVLPKWVPVLVPGLVQAPPM